MKGAMSATPAVQSFRMIPFLKPERDAGTVLLTEHQREKLVQIGIRARLPARMPIYAAQSPAHWVFAVTEGVVKSYRELASGKRNVAAFLFARDLFGLAADGRYVNSTQSVTPVTLYRLPVAALAALLKHDGDMQFKFLAKVTHELRESQRRAILLSRRDAAGRLAMFISMIGERLDHPAAAVRVVTLPMTRSDIAGFIGLTLESVSRSAAKLQREGLVRFEGQHVARILDTARFSRLVASL
jgi:CRP/FNR family transcriptional regulator, anaerobic regulatory protein